MATTLRDEDGRLEAYRKRKTETQTQRHGESKNPGQSRKGRKTETNPKLQLRYEQLDETDQEG